MTISALLARVYCIFL